jgi:hypothetical protein
MLRGSLSFKYDPLTILGGSYSYLGSYFSRRVAEELGTIHGLRLANRESLNALLEEMELGSSTLAASGEGRVIANPRCSRSLRKERRN